jgi:hypothetical protein
MIDVLCELGTERSCFQPHSPPLVSSHVSLPRPGQERVWCPSHVTEKPLYSVSWHSKVYPRENNPGHLLCSRKYKTGISAAFTNVLLHLLWLLIDVISSALVARSLSSYYGFYNWRQSQRAQSAGHGPCITSVYLCFIY